MGFCTRRGPNILPAVGDFACQPVCRNLAIWWEMAAAPSLCAQLCVSVSLIRRIRLTGLVAAEHMINNERPQRCTGTGTCSPEAGVTAASGPCKIVFNDVSSLFTTDSKTASDFLSASVSACHMLLWPIKEKGNETHHTKYLHKFQHSFIGLPCLFGGLFCSLDNFFF